MKISKKAKYPLAAILSVLILAGGYCGVMKLMGRAPALNFEVVDQGRLLRSAQPGPADLDRMLADQGLKTILSLRGIGDYDERKWARDRGVNMVIMQMYADDPPTDDQIGLFFTIMRGDTVDLDRYSGAIERSFGLEGRRVKFPLPLLIHCEGGADRTGVMVALYRMAFQGWTLDQAKQEMTRRRHFSIFHPRLFKFLDRVAPRINKFYGADQPVKKKAAGEQE
jgi:protein tyrosine/serine phosphatase